MKDSWNSDKAVTRLLYVCIVAFCTVLMLAIGFLVEELADASGDVMSAEANAYNASESERMLSAAGSSE